MMLIIRKIKEKGLLWLIARVRQELRFPSNKSVKAVIDFLLSAKKRIRSFSSKTVKDDLLYGIYDLEVNDLTYFAAVSLVDFEIESRRNNKKGFILVIVPSSLDPKLGWKEYDSVIDSDSKLWRFQNIVLPLTFSPYCRGVYVLPCRSDAIDFAKNMMCIPIYDGINLRKLTLTM